MAEAEVDLGQLTEDQQLALQQYIAVTDQQVKDAVPLLQRCQWNVQVYTYALLSTFPGLIMTDCHSSLLRWRTGRGPHCGCSNLRRASPTGYPPARDSSQWFHKQPSFIDVKSAGASRPRAPRRAATRRPGHRSEERRVGKECPV